jgi:hypothetical protein
MSIATNDSTQTPEQKADRIAETVKNRVKASGYGEKKPQDTARKRLRRLERWREKPT